MLREDNGKPSPLARSLRETLRAYLAELIGKPRTSSGIKLLLGPVGLRGHCGGHGIGSTESLLVDEYMAGACAASQVRLHGC